MKIHIGGLSDDAQTDALALLLAETDARIADREAAQLEDLAVAARGRAIDARSAATTAWHRLIRTVPDFRERLRAED